MSPRAAKNLRPQQLMEVITRFRKTGSVSPEKGPEARQKRARTAENVAKVRDHFMETPRTSLRKYSHVLAIKKTSLREIKKKNLKMKPYKLHRSQELTEDHKKQRYDFCKWIIDEEIDPNKIIFTDEKWFCLSGPSNRQNTRIRSISNPFLTKALLMATGLSSLAPSSMIHIKCPFSSFILALIY